MMPNAGAGPFWTNAAFWAAGIALLTFVLSKVYELVVRRYDYWDARNASVVRFRTDVTLRRDDLLSKQQAYNDPGYRRKIIDLIEQHAAEGRAFRLYGVEVSDTGVQDEISGYLASFPERSQAFIRRTILRDRQMVALYHMMTNDAFEHLKSDRQIEAFERWILSVNELIKSLEDLTTVRDEWAPRRAGPLAKLLRLSREG